MSEAFPTTLITGASSGIGAALARQLATAGHQLILIARDKERLKAIADQCEELSHLKPLVIPIDLSNPDAYGQIQDKVVEKGMTVDFLINNAGFGLVGPFDQIEQTDYQQLVQVNNLAVVALTHLFLKSMRAKNSGHIINIGSVYSFAPVPLQAIYAASKAFLLSFTLSLAEELKGTNITVSILCPGTTETNFRKSINPHSKEPSRFLHSANFVANKIYKVMQQKSLIYIPGFYNKLFVLLISWLPFQWQAALVKKIVYKLRDYKQ